MIFLDSTLRKLQVVLGAAVTTTQLPWVASYVDITSTPSLAPASATGVTSSTTAVDMVAAPAASTQRQLKYLNIFNADTVAATVTVQFNDNGTVRILTKGTLAVGESLVFDAENGWTKVSINGTPGQILGTGTNDAAASGNVREYLTNSASGIAMTSGADKSVGSLTLTPGEWIAWGTVNFAGNPSTTLKYTLISISEVNNSADTTLGRDWRWFYNDATAFAILSLNQPTSMLRKQVAVGTTLTIYLVAEAGFGVSTCTCGGILNAARVR